jgi:beta-amylase
MQQIMPQIQVLRLFVSLELRHVDHIHIHVVQGVMVDVWWGICEREGPGCYDFEGYAALFDRIAAIGLKVQAVMSFHAAGANVGDTCNIPLPPWVTAVGERDHDIFYTDRAQRRNRECLSLSVDREPIFWGKTPLEVYAAYIRAFSDCFQHLFGAVFLCCVPDVPACQIAGCPARF